VRSTARAAAIYAKCVRKLDEHLGARVEEQMIQEFGFGVSPCQVGQSV
jgi:hypothetical protein